MPGQRWLPLESNPDVMNKYSQDLGVSAKWQFADVFGLEPELLGMVPRPVAAVLLLYPLSDKAKATPLGTEEPETKDIYFTKQTIGNACGTVGLIHALLNNTDRIDLDAAKHLKTFYDDTKGKTPEERATYLENDAAFGAAHEGSAQEGQTQAPPAEEEVKHHFVAFVHHSGGLYELDGRRSGPVRHGDTTVDSLMEDTAKVVKKFMERDPEEVKFTVVALVQA